MFLWILFLLIIGWDRNVLHCHERWHQFMDTSVLWLYYLREYRLLGLLSAWKCPRRMMEWVIDRKMMCPYKWIRILIGSVPLVLMEPVRKKTPLLISESVPLEFTSR